ncbi:MmcQ/YjbR family DNA-binding protein [Paenibacillus sp. CF384]|uniref:MmcQ/YjbR family DNA-binding protein n=1 Tax=Paenibacillus sp. CF384 TaxID=1884382 RepID=UPI0008996DE4|nr:MmcQ/YjbR family DNA-binding protein [Paenibacillus sp. CF384]SDX50508.1 hypothetical protein SAMN05518855_101586 [Paenibacillus sp. CF384]
MITEDQIRSYALSLPETDEVDHWGKPSFRVRNKIYAVIQPDGVSLLVKLTADDRAAYTTMDPAVYQVPPKYATLNYVIIQLELVDPNELKSLLFKAWSLVAPKRVVKSFVT